MGKKLYATERLLAAREERGVSQQEFADILDLQLDESVGYQTYQKWENGGRSIPVDAALVLSRFLKIPLKELVTSK